MKVRLLWFLPLLCACGSSTRLAHDPSGDRDSGQAHIHWTRPSPIATRELDVERRPTSEAAPAVISHRPAHTEAISKSEPVVTADAMTSAALENRGTDQYPAARRALSPSPAGNTALIAPRTDENDAPRSEKPMNKLAVSAFVASSVGLVGGIFLGLLWSLVVVGFVLGIIALIQIAHRKERGMGFAIASILLLVAWVVLILLVLENGL